MGIVRIEVVAFDGRPPTLELAAEFDELGGTIGRDASCTLVLPDPEKRISRRHGVVVLRDGRYVLRDEGSAIPIRHNGRAVGVGHEVALAPGDQIDIGAYALRVSVVPARPLATPASSGEDALLAPLGGGSVRRDPFADLAPRAASSAPGGIGSSPASRAAEILPPDFDPFAEPAAPERATPVAAAGPTDPLGLGFAPAARDESVDKLFGLTPGEPFPPGHPLAPAPASPPERGIDGLLAPARARAAAPTPQRDDVAELHGSIRLPEPKRESPASLEISDGLVVSWEQPADDGKGSEVRTLLIPPMPPGTEMPGKLPGGPAVRPAATPAADLESPPPTGSAELGAATPPAAPPPIAIPEAPARPDPGARAAAGAQRDALLAAFLEGAGVPEVPVRELTPELMRVLGGLLRIATQGTLDLLRARTAVKGELRAELTVIAPVENNPLKFSPNVDAALAHLLAPQGRGFMSPPRALQEAYRDLVAHQLGLAAGMRAALAATLARFDPRELEQRLGAGSSLDPLLPWRRRARLWDLYAAGFAELSDEAEQGFDRLFEREFVKAYEAQVARLAAGQPGDKG